VGFGKFAPLAIANIVHDLCRPMPPIQGAMLGRGFGFVMRWTAAAFSIRIAIHLHEQRLAAVRNAGVHRSQIASFTKLRALSPVGFPANDSHPPQFR
jgi:hypothetical protein